MEVDQFRPRLAAQLRIEVRQRFVHAEHRGLPHDRPRQRDALALTAAELTGLAIEVLGQAERIGSRPRLGGAIGLRRSTNLQRELDVGLRGLVWIEGVALKDHGDVAHLRFDVVDLHIADEDVARSRSFETGDHPQQGALPAT